MPAVAAEDVGGCPAAVEEEDGLLAALERGLKFMEQKPAKDPAMTGFQFIPHIHDVDGWKTSEVSKTSEV